MLHAQRDEVELYTSTWAIVETLRPRKAHTPSPLPSWSTALEAKDAKGNLVYPDALDKLKEIWDFWDKRHNSPARKLTDGEVKIITDLFTYPFVRKVTVDPVVAARAAEIARTTILKPADSIHVASALAVQCSCIQSWDRDYSATEGLIHFEKPGRLTQDKPLPLLDELAASHESFRLEPPTS